MSRRSRMHRPPIQSRAPVTDGGVGLDQIAAMRKQREAQLRAQVEGIAAGIYSSSVDLDCDDSEFNDLCVLYARRSIDAALIFAREIWGVQAQRVQAAEAPSGAEPPKPIIEG